MSAHAPDGRFPPAALAGAALLIVLTLLLVAYVRLSGIDIRDRPPQRPLAERALRFADMQDGAVAVLDADSGARIAVLPPGTNGFLRATMRNLAHERRRRRIDAAPPFHLLASTDGRLILEDPSTDERIDLEAFGSTNAAAFAAFLGVTP